VSRRSFSDTQRPAKNRNGTHQHRSRDDKLGRSKVTCKLSCRPLQPFTFLTTKSLQTNNSNFNKKKHKTNLTFTPGRSSVQSLSAAACITTVYHSALRRATDKGGTKKADQLRTVIPLEYSRTIHTYCSVVLLQ